MPMNNKIYTTTCTLKGVLASIPTPLNTWVPSECAETNRILYRSTEVMHLSMLCTYQLSKSPHPDTKIMVKSMVYLSSALCNWMINWLMSPPWGDWEHTSQSNSRGLPHLPPPPHSTLRLDIDRCITTEKNHQYSCKEYIYMLLN